MASLFQFRIQFPRRFQDFYEKVENLLLDYTVHEAYNQSEFYHQSYHKLSKHNFIDKEKLKDFPLVFRHQVEEAGTSICSKSADFRSSSHTGGTTSDNPLIIDRSIKEQQFLHDFFLDIEKDSKREVKLVLSLTFIPAGGALQIPVKNVFVFPVTLSDKSRLNLAVKLLKRSFRINGKEKVISCIAGSVGAIVMLTTYILQTGVKNIGKHINGIQTSTCYLTKYTSDWLKNFWKCDIMDFFSFTELFFKAAKCQECGLYHFDPFGIAEVLEVHANRRIDSGRGRLVVTGLYPFTQMTPLIRYFTGDLVEILKVDCLKGQYGYIFLGRQQNSLIFQKEYSGYTFLAGAEVYEALDGLPDVNIPKTTEFSPAIIGVKPIFWFENDPLNIINIELRYSPLLYPDRLKALSDIIKANLISRCNWLEGMFKKQLISLRFHPPDSAGKESGFRP